MAAAASMRLPQVPSLQALTPIPSRESPASHHACLANGATPVVVPAGRWQLQVAGRLATVAPPARGPIRRPLKIQEGGSHVDRRRACDNRPDDPVRPAHAATRSEPKAIKLV